MSSQFHNRLVGVTILVTSIVIFLPSIIDGKKMSYQQEFVETPIKPELAPHTQSFVEDRIIIESTKHAGSEASAEPEADEWKVEEVANTVDLESAPVSETKVTKTNIAAESAGSTDANNQAKIPVKFPDTAWTIQLGAFQNKANINSLLKKLNKAGFQVHTIPKSVVDGQLTKVFVGPDVSKEKLEHKLPRLKRLTSLDGKLVPFNPLEP